MTLTLPPHGVPSPIRFTRVYSLENRGLRGRYGTMTAETKYNRRVGSSPREAGVWEGVARSSYENTANL